MRHYLVLSVLVVVGPLAFFVVRMRKKVSVCIQDPSGTVDERHGPGYANSRFSEAAH